MELGAAQSIYLKRGQPCDFIKYIFFSLLSLCESNQWIQKGFRAVEAGFVFELLYEPNFNKMSPPQCSRREQLDETIITHLNRFLTDHVRKLEGGILQRRPHLAGRKNQKGLVIN